MWEGTNAGTLWGKRWGGNEKYIRNIIIKLKWSVGYG